MATTTVLVRTKLTREEWNEIKALAAIKDVPVSELAADALRALLKGGKP